MSEHQESKTPRYVAYLAFAIVAIFIAVLAYNMWFAPSAEPEVETPTELSADAQDTATDTPETAATFGEDGTDFAPITSDDVVVELALKDGPVVIRLRPDIAPNHVAQILALADEGFYDGIVFHRVIKGFMAQTGDPTGTGMGGSELPDISAEFSGETFARGTIGMARSQSPDSANSQFFIMFAPAPHLDGQYTIVGEAVSGMRFVDAIKLGAAETNGTVIEPDTMISLELTQ